MYHPSYRHIGTSLLEMLLPKPGEQLLILSFWVFKQRTNFVFPIISYFIFEIYFCELASGNVEIKVEIHAIQMLKLCQHFLSYEFLISSQKKVYMQIIFRNYFLYFIKVHDFTVIFKSLEKFYRRNTIPINNHQPQKLLKVSQIQ